MRRLLSGAYFLAVCIFSSLVTAAIAAPFDVKLQSKTIENFKPGDTVKTFGSLQFIGGLEFTSTHPHVGAFSGLVVSRERNRLIAITDTGYWFTSTIRRDGEGRPLALENGRMAPILNASGKPFEHKWDADAESIAIIGNSALISFERDNRILRYSLDLKNFLSRPRRLKLNIETHKLRANKGLETVAIAPPGSPLKGATITVSERSFATKGQIKAAILDGPLKGRFTVERHGNFDITDGDFMPNGDLLLLERRFNLANGLGMRIRQIKAANIKPGAKLVGKKLLSADAYHQIDNMEGLSITTDSTGGIFLSLISDDNHSLLQRNIYLEFKLTQ